MCQHQPRCPRSRTPDHLAARIAAAHPEQGWSMLCNGVIVFDDGGELLPDGRAILPGPHAPLMARLIMPIMAPRIYASRARRVCGTPTPPRIQAAARLPAQFADEFGAEQATPDQTLGS